MNLVAAVCSAALAALLAYAVVHLRRALHRAQARLVDAERRLRESQQLAQLGSWDLDLERNVLSWSHEVFQIFEIDPSRFGASYDAFLALIHPQDRELVDRTYRSSVDSRESYQIVHRLIMGDGRVKTVRERGATYYDAVTGNPVRSIGTVQDISQEVALTERQSTLASVLEASHDFIGIATLDGKVTYLNKAARSLVGLEESDSAEEVAIRDLLSPDDLDLFTNSALPVIMRDGWTRAKLSIRNLRTDELIPVDFQGIIARDERNKPLALAAIGRDLRNERELEWQRTRLESQLMQAQKMDSLGRLTGGIAHDFNNSLLVTLGYCASLAESPHLGPEERKAVAAIEEISVRSRNLVAQLMGFSRQQVIAPRPLNLNDAVLEFERVVGRLLGGNIELLVLSEPRLWDILLDPVQLDQVLMNLATNARDAMPLGGTLTIETSNAVLDASSAAENPQALPGEYAVLTVSDTGVGMDATTASQMFEPFFTTKEKGRGTGLGLATVYGIVRQNGGFISVRSEVDRGTSLRVHLPRLTVDARSPPTAPARQEPAARSSHGKVLLVDDDLLVRATVARMLELLGYTPLVAESTQAAVEICRSDGTSIDLAVSDMVMPGISGAQLHQQLLQYRPGLKMLVISGYSSNEIARLGVLNPGVHFLQKPFSPEQLRDALERLRDAGVRPGGSASR